MRKIFTGWGFIILIIIIIPTVSYSQNTKVDFFTMVPQGKNALQQSQKSKLAILEKSGKNRAIHIFNVKPSLNIR